MIEWTQWGGDCKSRDLTNRQSDVEGADVNSAFVKNLDLGTREKVLAGKVLLPDPGVIICVPSTPHIYASVVIVPAARSDSSGTAGPK